MNETYPESVVCAFPFMLHVCVYVNVCAYVYVCVCAYVYVCVHARVVCISCFYYGYNCIAVISNCLSALDDVYLPQQPSNIDHSQAFESE